MSRVLAKTFRPAQPPVIRNGVDATRGERAAVTRTMHHALRTFWGVRRGSTAGGRTAAAQLRIVRGRKHLEALYDLVPLLLRQAEAAAGVEPGSRLRIVRGCTIPGAFCDAKQWDIGILDGDHVVAMIEFTTQAASFRSNASNRMIEIVGAATDLRTAVASGVLGDARPWIGYFCLLEDGVQTRQLRHRRQPNIPGTFTAPRVTIAERFRYSMERLKTQGLVDGATLVLSAPRKDGRFRDGSPELGLQVFTSDLRRHLVRHCRRRMPRRITV